MKKRGNLLLLFGIVFLIIIIVLLIGVYYFYNFHVFKTVRICVGEPNSVGLPCQAEVDCWAYMGGREAIESQFDDAPDFLKEKMSQVLDLTVTCDQTCFASEVRGLDLQSQNVEVIDECYPEEQEVKLDVRGKEALALWEFYKTIQE